MHVLHETEEHVVECFRLDAASMRPDLSQTAEPETGDTPRMASPFSVSLLAVHEHEQDAAVLSVRGEIDLGTAPMLREALQPALERYTGAVVVDLSEVPFIDSTGVHVLIDTLQRLEPHNRRLAIVCSEGGQVHQLLAMVALLDRLAVHPSRESAVIAGDDLLRPEPSSRS
jgi:anti-sigma B factor antagonist